MRGVVCAVAIGRTQGDVLLVDPSDEEAVLLTGGGCYAFMFSDTLGTAKDNSECVWTNWRSWSGSFNEKELVNARELARTAARKLLEIMKENVSSMGQSQPAKRNMKTITTGGRNRPMEEDDDEAKMEI